MEENKQLQLLDVLGIPLISNINTNNNNNQNNIIFNHKEKSLIYSLGSNIIYYNLKKDSKTFLQYFCSNIGLLKLINDSDNILLIITNSSFPILSIWQIPSFIGIYSREITTQSNFEVGQIFFEKINSITYLILITSKNNNSDNFLYSLNVLKNGKYDITFFGKLKYIITKITGFNIFYNSNHIVFLMSHNLQYYTIDLKNEKCILKKNINFSFKLKENSIRISKINNLLCVLTTKGNCLIYDQNGINKPTINPLGQECFTTCEFCENSLCLGTSHGNIYVYNIYGFKLKYMIRYNDISSIKTLSLINKNDINNQNNKNKYISNNEIIYISMNENLDQLFVIFKENYFIFMSIRQLINKEKYNYNLNSPKTNTITFYSFNQSNKILDLCINPNDNKNNYNDIIFYSCSQEHKLIKYYIEQNTDKLRNQYYDLSHIISTSKQNNITKKYLTVLQIHPIFNYKLFAGDNKGFLYIINLDVNSEDSNLKFRKYNIGNYEIVFLNFSQKGNLLCIGFETGYQLIYKTYPIFECVLKLNENYLNIENIENRKINNHILAYCSFLNNKRNRHCIIYTKDHNIIEYSKLYKSDNGLFLTKKTIVTMTIKNTILDIAIHKSESYVIILNDKRQILINSILVNKTTAVIDLSSQIKKIYNFQIDMSGLYLAIVCDMNKKSNKNNENDENNESIIDVNKKDIIIIEINTSKVKNYIIQTTSISKIIFDNFGKYIILGGELGDISLWRLNGEMTSSIKNFIGEIEKDINFWDKFEIKYNNNDNEYSIFSISNTDKDNYLNISDSISFSDDNNTKERENRISDEMINNNIYPNYNSNNNNGYKQNKNRNINRIKSMGKIFNYKKNGNNYEKIYRNHNFIDNYYTENCLSNNIRNTNGKFFNKNDRFKQYILSKNKNKYNNNQLLYSDNLNNKYYKNKNKYNFWSLRDTINIKRSINKGHYKYPEPIDIDDYLSD